MSVCQYILNLKRTKTNKTYTTYKKTMTEPTYNILRSFQLPPSLTRHLPNYHEVVLRRHKLLFTISQCDGHRMFPSMPSSHGLFRGNWTPDSQQNFTTIEKLRNSPGILGLPCNSQDGHFGNIRNWLWNSPGI